MENLGKMTAIFGSIAILGILGALVLKAMWGWFVVPLGVAPIGLAHAYGLYVLASYLTYQSDSTTEADTRDVSKAVVGIFRKGLMRIVVTALAAFIAYSLM